MSGEVLGVITEAGAIASEFGHNYIGTEHILLASAKRKDVDVALRDHGSSGAEISRRLTHMIGRGPNHDTPALTARSKRVLDLAATATSRRSSLPDTEVTIADLMAGLVQEKDGIAAGVLTGSLRERLPSLLYRLGNPPDVDPDDWMRTHPSPIQTTFTAMLSRKFHTGLQPGRLVDGSYLCMSEPAAIEDGRVVVFKYEKFDVEGKEPTRRPGTLTAKDFARMGEYNALMGPAWKRVIERDGYFSLAKALTTPGYYDRRRKVSRWPETLSMVVLNGADTTTTTELILALNLPLGYIAPRRSNESMATLTASFPAATTRLEKAIQAGFHMYTGIPDTQVLAEVPLERPAVTVARFHSFVQNYLKP